MADETAVSEMYEDGDRIDAKDIKAAQATLKRNAIPTGVYVSMPDEYEPRVEKFKFDGDDRQQWSVFLRAALVVKGGDTVEQGLRFKYSKEERKAPVYGADNKPTGELSDKDDGPTKRYAELLNAFLEFQGEDGKVLENMEQIADFIRTTPLNIRTYLNRDGSLGVGGQGTVISLKKSR